ncbi:hypothetical protein BD310DRAFT_932839 [Dichomitus squalens]|uniref:Uncharacterized protein n=1 Tax=Dichomitus squalens TaxID=114155 RepID=A0A4Q9PNH5_9APHY|nr:hypothetical protein BD310DRAFT_932839 [Dichomitus squalens]
MWIRDIAQPATTHRIGTASGRGSSCPGPEALAPRSASAEDIDEILTGEAIGVMADGGTRLGGARRRPQVSYISLLLSTTYRTNRVGGASMRGVETHHDVHSRA